MYVVSFKQASATGHKAINPGCVSVANHIVIYARQKASWRPNRVFTGRQRDKRYANWIQNVTDDHSMWRIQTLMQGFASANSTTLKEARKISKDNPELLDQFVLANAKSVIQPANPDYNAVGQETKEAIDASLADPKLTICVSREGYPDIYLKGGKRLLFYSDKIKIIDGVPVSGEPLTTLWDDVLSNNIHAEGGIEFPKGKKPEALIKRCFELATDPKAGDLVMDSFGGSGTTAAVAHKMGLKYLTVEMEDHAETHIARRLRKITEGLDESGITKEVRWQGGGGFRFCRLGVPLFVEYGDIAEAVTFPDLAAHIFFSETGVPIPSRAQSELLGIHQSRAVYLLFDSAHAGAAREAAGNVLTPDRLTSLPSAPQGFGGTRVVYAEGCTVSADRLRAAGLPDYRVGSEYDPVPIVPSCRYGAANKFARSCQ